MSIADNEPVVAFILARYPQRSSIAAMAQLGLNRLPLMRTSGLRFWRLFGVGRGRVFDPHPDWQRYAMFTVWDSYASLKQFETHSALLRGIHRRAEEVWTVHMLPVRWHGTWGGRDPLAGITSAPAPNPGPWVILTRASLRFSKIRPFLAAVPSVAEQLLQQPEFITSVGIGETPLIHQATLSLWRTLPAITSFAYGPAAHADVIHRTRREQWYREELFARFRPVTSKGTWDGIDPLGTMLSA